MKIKIGISPCPNDTFIFDAIFNKRIPLQGLEFEFLFADVEQLNQAAINNEIALTKMSYYAYSKVASHYQILSSGGALGNNCGPLLICKDREIKLDKHTRVAIPGFNTTANFLLSLAYPDLVDKHEVLFSDIETAVINGQYDLGLIIHESRFTYAAMGLHKIKDLGEYWEDTTHAPIPLGCIAIQRAMDQSTKEAIQEVISHSVKYAFEHPAESQSFIKSYSQSLSDEVIAAHIGLYVNDYSIELGHQGRQGVITFYEALEKFNGTKLDLSSIFVNA